MSTSTQQSFTSVLSVNPYKETYFSGISSFISKAPSPEYSKEQFVLSYLNTKDFINAQIEISKNIPDEDLFDAINSKAYDELALDQAIEYKIQYIETFNVLDEENRHFHVFIVDPIDITNTFLHPVEKIKYIDIIIPAPLLIKSIYAKDIIESNGLHCFIYIQENDAFITIYEEQEFVYTKSIKFSLMDMHERFCELYGERIDYDEFLNFFSKESLRDSNSNYKQFFIRLYKELFANINDILTYARRAFEIEKFEHVYIGTQVQTITKLHEMLEVELNIKSSEFDFDYGFETNEQYVDQLHMLMHLYNTLPKDEKYTCNFTLYKRPPKFIKRESGKLIILVFASFALAFAYPITYWILTYAQGLQEDLLKQEYQEIHINKITREATIKNKIADKDKAITLLEEEKKEYIEKKNTLMKIHKVKVDYPMKAKLLATFAKELNRFHVNVQSLKYSQPVNSKILLLNLVANKDRKITQLVEYLTKMYEGKFHFDLKEIKLDKETNKYFSTLKVKIL
ncbi:hypothetical protein [Sulfurimonas sp.]|uniref:hypothetical protein n=1 Tax=Sulfurimonas sp. TaxID=2022749 RepID=UPI00262F98B7|nr:hypothetical protein [Sulfurimonas sp.]